VLSADTDSRHSVDPIHHNEHLIRIFLMIVLLPGLEIVQTPSNSRIVEVGVIACACPVAAVIPNAKMICTMYSEYRGLTDSVGFFGQNAGRGYDA
jgi:hypothetical protein